MEILGVLALLASVAGLTYNIYNTETSRKQNNALNAQAQSNFENQYLITSEDMKRSGINPMSMFNGGQLNSFVSGESFQAPENPFGSLVDTFSNLQNNSLRRTEIENQKAVQEANINLTKAQTIAQLLDNEKVQSLLQGENGNLFVKKLLSECGVNISNAKLSESQSNYYDNYWLESEKLQNSINETNKYIASQNNATQKVLQANAQKFEKELTKIKALQSLNDKQVEHYLAVELSRIQHQFKAKESVISGIFNSWSSMGYASVAHPKLMDNMLQRSLNSCSPEDFNSKADFEAFKNALNEIFDKLN